MKNIHKINLAFPAVFILLFFLSHNKLQAQTGPESAISYQTFYDDLSPFGSWIDYPAYGQVWHPNVNGNFRPYLTNGAWDYSSSGWMWTSNYSWGWAPFHYGRWVYDDMYGWLWIPGYEWSPAWVTWGMFGDNYAWAPLMPGINVSLQFGSYRPHSFYWNAVPRQHIYDRDIYKRSLTRNQIDNSVTNITVINNYGNTRGHHQYYSKGPQINEVEKYTQRTITPAVISERNSVGPTRREGNKLQVYRPSVNNPEPREFRNIDKDHVHPLIENENQSERENEPSARGNVAPVPDNENSLNRNMEPKQGIAAPVTGRENSLNKNVEPVKADVIPLQGNENSLNRNTENGKTNKTNVEPLNRQTNVEQERLVKMNNENPQNTRNNSVQLPIRNNVAPVAPVYRNVPQQHAIRHQEELRNNEIEQRQNVERLPVVHVSQPSIGRRSGGNRKL